MTNKVWLIFIAVFLLLLSSCASEPVSNEQEPPTQAEPVDQIESPSPSLSLWSEEEITVLSKMVWGEARGIPSDTEKAACVWCVLNRVDYGYGNIVMVVTAPYQFAGYDIDNPIDDEIKALCEDVLTRWYAEKPMLAEFSPRTICGLPEMENTIISAMPMREVKLGIGVCNPLIRVERCQSCMKRYLPN